MLIPGFCSKWRHNRLLAWRMYGTRWQSTNAFMPVLSRFKHCKFLLNRIICPIASITSLGISLAERCPKDSWKIRYGLKPLFSNISRNEKGCSLKSIVSFQSAISRILFHDILRLVMILLKARALSKPTKWIGWQSLPEISSS